MFLLCSVGGKVAAVRLAHSEEEREKVSTEARVYDDLLPLQGVHVPVALASGDTLEGFTYMATQLVKVIPACLCAFPALHSPHSSMSPYNNAF